jgi:hypothetical protein
MTSSGPSASAIIAIEAVQALVATNYLAKEDVQNHAKIARAITRFQRHAARSYRMPQPDTAPTFNHAADGVLDEATLAQLRLWVQRKWVLPVGRFQVTTFNVGGPKPVQLRQDAAIAWSAIIALATRKGATLGGEYGDSARPVRPSAKKGTSRYSFHYCARAVDISQDFTKSANHRYFIASEPTGPQQFWRIWCKADKQDGSQGTLIGKHAQKQHQFNPAAEIWIPAGYYVDLTALIESTGCFERIHAQAGWQGDYNKAEWWHFQFKKDKQPTFLDEMELIGYTEARLRACGWNSDALLDHPPG